MSDSRGIKCFIGKNVRDTVATTTMTLAEVLDTVKQNSGDRASGTPTFLISLRMAGRVDGLQRVCLDASET